MRTSPTILLLVALAAALCAHVRPAAGDTAEQQFKEAYQQLLSADEARDAGGLSRAIALYRDALNSYMRLSERYPDWQRGIVRFRIAYCDNQLESILKEIDDRSVQQAGLPSTDPSELGAKLNNIHKTAASLMEAGDAENARALLIEGLRLSPDDRKLRLMTGIAQCEAGQYENALLLLEPLRDDWPESSLVRVALAAAYFGIAEMANAVRELEQALERDPALTEAHYNMAQALAAQESFDLETAREHYRKALHLGGKPDKDLAKRLRMP